MPSRGMLLLAALAALWVRPAAAAPADHWVRAWGQAVQDVSGGLYPPEDRLQGPVTIRQRVRLSVGGGRLAVRFSNLAGPGALQIGAAHVARLRPDGTIDPASDRALTFSGAAAIGVPPGAPIVSDPVELAVAPLGELAVTLYLPGGMAAGTTAHLSGRQAVLLAAGNHLADASLPDARHTPRGYYLQAVDVAAPAGAGTLVAFGDSITDGAHAAEDQFRTWPDRLAERLAFRRGAPPLAVDNAGIGGNGLLRDLIGQSALVRFDRDALAVPGVRTIVLLEGINDILVGTETGRVVGVSAASLIAGYRQLIDRAHAAGVRIVGATLMPDQTPGTPAGPGEPIRQAVNAWLRTAPFDGLVDLDKVTADPADPLHLRPAYASPDYIHPSDDGYDAIAAAVLPVVTGLK